MRHSDRLSRVPLPGGIMSVTHTLKRDLSAQLRQSRNLNESCWMKIKRALWVAVYLLKGFAYALRAVRREQLGSSVIYKGKQCWISNRANSEKPTLSGPDFYERNCERKDIESVMSLQEICHRFDAAFGFYMGNWHAIDVNRKLYREVS